MKKRLFAAAALSASLLLSLSSCGFEQIGPSDSAAPISTLSTDTSALTTTVSSSNSASTSATGATTSGLLTTALTTTLTTAAITTAAETTAAAAASSQPAVTAPAVTDQSVLNKVKAMSLDEKIGQMLIVCCKTEDSDTYSAKKGAGGLCLYENAFKGKSAAQVTKMTKNLQSLAKTPMILATDEEGGSIVNISSNNQLRKYPFLSPSQLYKQGGFDLIDIDTAEKSKLLLSLGINVNFAPVCDVPLSEKDYIYDRSFGLKAADTAKYITHVVNAMNKKNIGSTLKHFPGYSSSGNTHTGSAVDERDYSAFEKSDFLPFTAGIQAGAGSVMVSHCVVKCMDESNPASLSPNVHKILREKLNFNGVIMTDALGMDAIAKTYSPEESAVKAVEAGNDMLCITYYDKSVKGIHDAVESGRIAESTIDASVARVLNWKKSLKLIQ